MLKNLVQVLMATTPAMASPGAMELHRDLMAEICSFLDIDTRLASIARLSKAWRDSLKHPLVWRHTDLSGVTESNLPRVMQLWHSGECCPYELDVPFIEFMGGLRWEFLNGIHSLSLTRHGIASLVPHLASLQNLTTLSLQELSYIGVPIKLPNMPQLLSLSIEGCLVQHVFGLPALTSLSLSCQLHDSQQTTELVASIVSLSNLTNLRWFGPDLFIPIACNQTATNINSSKTVINDNHPIKFCSAGVLISLECYFPGPTDIAMCSIAQQFTHLQELLIWPSVSDDVAQARLRALGSMASLRKLTIRSAVWVEDADMQPLSSLTQLEELELDNCSHITDAVFAHLAPLSSLRKLEVRDCPGITSLAPHIQACRQLQDLRISSARMSDADCEALSHLHELHTLRVWRTPSPTGMRSLCSLSKTESAGDLQLSGAR